MKSYREERTLKTRDCDMTAAWRPSAVLEAMQETAEVHSCMLGAGWKALRNLNLAWVITRLEMEMDRYPAVGERVSVETWHRPVRRWFFPRYFMIRDSRDREIGRAASLWVLLDLRTRQMARPDQVAALMPDNTDLPAPLGLPAPVTEVSGTLQVGSYTPLYTDMDANGHVNNCRYADWACNALGLQALTDWELSRFQISFNSEVRPGEALRTELKRLDDRFSFCCLDGEKRCVEVGGSLRPRKARWGV